MSGISTHVLDTSKGRPAAGVPITLSIHEDGSWKELGHGSTDADGRLRTLLGDTPLRQALYRLTFDVASYSAESFFPEASIVFRIQDETQHYHVPLLFNPYGYSTYRGS